MTEDNDHLPFVVHSATKVTLKPAAKFWAAEHGMSLEQMARHLLDQHAQEFATGGAVPGTAVPGAADYNPMNQMLWDK
jgi:hypothetical protein